MQDPDSLNFPVPGQVSDRPTSLQESTLDELDRHCGNAVCLSFTDELSVPGTLECHSVRSPTTELHSQHLDADVR